MNNLRLAPQRDLLWFIDYKRELSETRVGIPLRLNVADLFHEDAIMTNVGNTVVRDLDVFWVEFWFSDVYVERLEDALLKIVEIAL